MAILEADIEVALKAAIDGAGLSWPIAYPNIHFNGAKPYIGVQIVRVARRDETLNGELTISRGQVIASVVVALGTSTKTANQKADQFAALFLMGRRIPVTGGEIVIMKPADIREGYPQDADWRTPVIVDYEAS
ncbi:phage tail terminator-like protein [Shinella sp.]|uniref:phage tail terminator-like protein n=1 Tax=Shinella sp. TaxID=1870904 RepID=UPI00403571E8